MREELKKIGEGNTAEIFELDSTKVVKLFKTGYSKSLVEYEYTNHKNVSALVKNVPRIYDFVEEDGRYGYIMEFIQGESLASSMMNEMTFVSAMDSFTSLHKEWLLHKTDKAISYKEWMLNVLNNKQIDENLIHRINALPDGNTLCHGDFHPFNIIQSPKGQLYVIDFANICKAPKEYDIARTYSLLKEADIEVPIAEIYLENMDVTYESIQQYVDVLSSFRKIEME